MGVVPVGWAAINDGRREWFGNAGAPDLKFGPEVLAKHIYVPRKTAAGNHTRVAFRGGRQWMIDHF